MHPWSAKGCGCELLLMILPSMTHLTYGTGDPITSQASVASTFFAPNTLPEKGMVMSAGVQFNRHLEFWVQIWDKFRDKF